MGVLFIPLWLGIDVGGSKLAVAVAEDAGPLIARRRWPAWASGSAAADVEAIADAARVVLAEAGARADEVAAVGVSCPGPLDAERGVVLGPPNLPGWDEVPLTRWLGEALGRPVHLENDANAAALAEWSGGAGRGLRHLVYLTMSTGVGAGLILDGRLHRGAGGAAGELGHAPVEWEGEACACGRQGCLEAYVGGAAWTRRLRATVPDASAVVALAGAREQVRPEHVVEAARAGDAFALAELDRYNDYLARGIVWIAYALAPEAVILGTIPTHAGEALCLEAVRARVTRRLWPRLARTLRILPSALGDDLGYHAGLCAARYCASPL